MASQPSSQQDVCPALSSSVPSVQMAGGAWLAGQGVALQAHGGSRTVGDSVRLGDREIKGPELGPASPPPGAVFTITRGGLHPTGRGRRLAGWRDRWGCGHRLAHRQLQATSGLGVTCSQLLLELEHGTLSTWLCRTGQRSLQPQSSSVLNCEQWTR